MSLFHKLKNIPFLIYVAVHLIQYDQKGYDWQFLTFPNLFDFIYFIEKHSFDLAF